MKSWYFARENQIEEKWLCVGNPLRRRLGLTPKGMSEDEERDEETSKC